MEQSQLTLKFTLRDLRNRASQKALKADFEAYLDGFSPNVREILKETEGLLGEIIGGK
jgi:type I restriction enzyme M protein